MSRSNVYRLVAFLVGAGVLSMPSPARVMAADTGKNVIGDVVFHKTAAPELTTFAKLLESAQLVDVLQGKGPFTIVAPSDAAFAKLPASVLDELTRSENKAKLAALLRHHIHAGELIARKDLHGQALSTLDGQTITLNGAAVNNAISCDNGVVYVIDTVLLPAPDAK